MKKIEISAAKDDKVLNIVSRQISEISYSMANAILRKKDIRVNGEKIKDNINVVCGDNISVFISEEKLFAPKAFEIFYEDKNICVVNKFKGIEVSDGDNNIEKLLSGERKSSFYAVHRLDRNTEGLVIFAKSKSALAELNKAMKKNQIRKFYITEVIGSPKKEMATETAYLLKDSEKSEVKIFNSPVKDSEKIITKYVVIKRSGGTSVLEVELLTGKTHQIRAHLSFLGFPIVGDGKYGDYNENKKYKEKTQKLMAYKLVFEMEGEFAYLNGIKFETKPEFLGGKA